METLEYNGVEYTIEKRGRQWVIKLPDHPGAGFGVARSRNDAIQLAECNIELNELEWEKT